MVHLETLKVTDPDRSLKLFIPKLLKRMPLGMDYMMTFVNHFELQIR